MNRWRRGPSELVLTTANRGQARATIRAIRGDARLDEAIRAESRRRLLVVPDAGGRRVGSGVATLAALRVVAERERRRRGRERGLPGDPEAIADLLADRTIAIVHSGGDSRRLPAYAAEGKIFAPMPTESDAIGTPTLLERIVGDLDEVETPSSGGILIASGDVWLDVGEASLRFGGDRLEIVAFRASPERGRRHGVFVAGADEMVEQCLQKPSPEAARESGAVDAEGMVLLDSGMVFVPTEVAASWIAVASACGVFDPDGPQIDLYADLLPATVRRWQATRTQDDRTAAFLERVRESGIGGGLRVRRLARCAFRHTGSTRELLEETASSNGVPFRRDETLRSESEIASGAYVDRCGAAVARLAPGAMLVGSTRDPGFTIDLPTDRGLVVLPVHGGSFAAIAFGRDDDFKSPREAGGTLLGGPLLQLPLDCWLPDEKIRTLWTARLWPVGELESVVRRALMLVEDPTRRDGVDGRTHSAAEIFAMVDHRRLVEDRRKLRFESLGGLLDRVEPGVRQARLLRAAADARSDRSDPEVWRRRAFAAVAQAVAAPSAAAPIESSRRSTAIADRVAMQAPVRIDLAGGWTDTPPICLERGGAVVNVAIEVDGRPPLEASVTRLDAPLVRIESRDLDRRMEFGTVEDLTRTGDPRDPDDWALLPRAAVCVSGLLQGSGAGDLGARLERVGGGFELRIASTLPKGSGLGTSSMLGALAIAALRRAAGIEFDRSSLIAATSDLEQRMGTAGGWQDQAGGITGGAKLLQTAPGADQIPTETPLALPEAFWRDRVIVHSTGRQRLARNILQQVVWRWLGGGRRVLGIVDRIDATAHRLREAIDRGDDEAIAGSIGDAWRLKCELDPGSTTPEIEAMVDPVAGELSSWTLPGAGGGGFLMLIAKDAAAADRVRARCRREPLHPGGRLHAVTVAGAGIRESPSPSSDLA